MNRGIELYLLLGIASALPACSGGAPVAVDSTEAAASVSSPVYTDVRAMVAETGETIYHAAMCDHSRARYCKARIRTDAAGHPLVSPFPGGGGGASGLGPTDLQAAYGLDPSIDPQATVAIIDAYGYPNLESDLAKYRSNYQLPACTTANGCLTIVNQDGKSSPLPAGNTGWEGETALDVDMASAACPKCKILVVQANDEDTSMPNLEMSQATAAMLGATVASDSWGGSTTAADAMGLEHYFDVSPSKMGIFIASGDSGYDNGGQGPDYPSTSEFVIGVGGTTLTKSSGSARGWTETAWSGAGSSCSDGLPTPPWQMGVSTSCTFRAASDVSAVANPSSAVATYCNGQWVAVGGTSAASPLTAAIFALYGHGQVKGDFVYNNKTIWNDVTSGSNGSCGNVLCKAGVGWDGPTGLGTPSGKALAMIPPGDGSTPPDMAMPRDMATPPDLAMAPDDLASGTGTGGNGGSGGTGGTGGNGGSGGTGGSGGSGNHGGGGCSVSGSASAGGLWLFLVFAAAILSRSIRVRR